MRVGAGKATEGSPAGSLADSSPAPTLHPGQIEIALDVAPLVAWKCIVCGFETTVEKVAMSHVANSCGPVVLIGFHEAARAAYLDAMRAGRSRAEDPASRAGAQENGL